MNVQTTVISVEDALIYGMVTLAAVDRVMTDRELRTIGDVVRSLPVFRDYDVERVVPTAEACGAKRMSAKVPASGAVVGADAVW